MIYGKHLIFDNYFIIPVNDDDISGVEHGFHGMAVHPAGHQVGTGFTLGFDPDVISLHVVGLEIIGAIVVAGGIYIKNLKI